MPHSLPPHNTEAEQAILGGLLLDPAAAAEWTPRLRAEDFNRESHRLIFSAVADLQSQGHAADLVTVTDRLRERGQLDQAGGPSYVTSLLNATFSPAMLPTYASMVRREATRRALRPLGLRLARASRNGTDLEALAAEARDALDALEMRTTPDGPQAVSLEDLLADQSPPPAALVEGLIFPQTITLLAGYTKVGKTQFVLQLARAVVSGQPVLGLAVPAPASVLYVGQEDALWALRERFRGIHPRFGPAKAGLHLVCAKGLLLEGHEVRRLVAEYRPGLVILDPLRRFHIREEEKGEMAVVIRQVDLLIRDFACAVVEVHHLRKPSADKKRRPEVADVRGSSVITDQANTIALLAEDEDQGTFTLTVTGNYVERHTLRLQRVGAVFERRGTNEGLTTGEAVAAFADSGPLTRAEAARVLQGRGLSRAQAYRRVTEMEQAGWLRAGQDGRLALEEQLLDASPGVRAGVSFAP